MSEAFICDFIRTPIGRFGGALASVRPDDLAAVPIRALMARHAGVDWAELDDVILGCANQAGEDNRNVARMAVLLSGLPVSVSGTTIFNSGSVGAQTVNTTGTQTYSGAATLGANTALTAGDTGVSFGGTVNGAFTLAITGNAVFGNGAGDFVGNAAALVSVTVSGTTAFNAGNTGANSVSCVAGRRRSLRLSGTMQLTGERTRLACRCRRLADSFVPLTATTPFRAEE